MATEICLTIADDGTMTISSEPVEVGEMAESGQPVATLDEALAAIKQMVEAGSAPQGEMPAEDTGAMDMQQQSAGMAQGFQPRR